MSNADKLDLAPPEHWPPEAKALYREFEARLAQRLVTARKMLLTLSRFFRFQSEQGLGWKQFPGPQLDAYLTGSASRGLWIKQRSALRLWLRFLYARKELLTSFHDELPRPKKQPIRRRILSYDQVMEILNQPPLDDPSGLRDRAMLEITYATAMRTGELVALDLGDVDLYEGTVHIRQAKNSYARIVPLTTWARHFLARYLSEARPALTSPLSGDALWLECKFGKRCDDDLLRKRLCRVYEAHKVLGFRASLHQLRHAAATHLLVGGADLPSVQELLGHRELNSTQIYTHVTPADLREVHQRCHPRNNGLMPGELD